MSIRENIIALRELYDITQGELATIAGVSRGAVSQWEGGFSEPRMGVIEKIANHFGIYKSNIIEEGGMYDVDPVTKKASIPRGICGHTAKVKGMQMGYVPLRGRVHAGPFTSPENLEGREELILAPQLLIDSDPDLYACEVEGDCMNKVYPEDNCIIFVSPNKKPSNGSIAVVTLDGCDALVRRMYRTANTLVLSPESWNTEHKDIVITSDSDHTVELGGKVVWFQSMQEMD
ncbi:MAG: XRE family transcriptional regulator [Raoultibacter sp.]